MPDYDYHYRQDKRCDYVVIASTITTSVIIAIAIRVTISNTVTTDCDHFHDSSKGSNQNYPSNRDRLCGNDDRSLGRAAFSLRLTPDYHDCSLNPVYPGYSGLLGCTPYHDCSGYPDHPITPIPYVPISGPSLTDVHLRSRKEWSEIGRP